MPSGDGLLTTLRPFAGRLEPAQVLALARLAEEFANGEVTLTRRGGIQLRGVSEANWTSLIEALVDDALAPAAPELESPRILVSPFAEPGGDGWALGVTLRAALAAVSDLPPKFTIVVDIGPRRELASIPADLRVERPESQGGVLVRLGPEPGGCSYSPERAVQTVLEAIAWFREHRTAARRSMAALMQYTRPPAALVGSSPPVGSTPPPSLGPHAAGTLLGAPFGVVSATTLRKLTVDFGVRSMRVTPWRSLLLEGVRDVTHPDLLTDESDPIVGVDACPGAPGCAQATVETRGLAHRLARRLRPGGRGPSIHVAGCSKGCARSRPADVVCVGRAGSFDLVRGGSADGLPVQQGLSPEQLLDGA